MSKREMSKKMKRNTERENIERKNIEKKRMNSPSDHYNGSVKSSLFLLARVVTCVYPLSEDVIIDLSLF